MRGPHGCAHGHPVPHCPCALRARRVESRDAVAQHLKRGHPENRSAQVAAARLEKVDDFLKITPEVRRSAPPPLTPSPLLSAHGTLSEHLVEHLVGERAQLLAQECGEIIWEPTEADIEEGHEEIRKPSEFKDRFNPTFELDTDAHHEWVRKAREEFE